MLLVLLEKIMTKNQMLLATVADQLYFSAQDTNDFWGMFIAKAALAGIFNNSN